MKVLLTGGAGFLGAWIVRTLASQGHAVRIFDVQDERSLVGEITRAPVGDLDWVRGDISDAQEVARAARGCDAVIHLAGMLTPACQANPVRGLQVNVQGTLNVFAAAREQGWPTVAYASTAGVFGLHDGRTPHPDTFYGTYKLACEGIARALWADHGVASVGLRPLVVYGPGRSVGSSAGVSLACRAAVLGEACQVSFTGTTGFVYVEDVARAFVAAAFSRPAGAQVFNMVGQTTTVDAFLDEIRRQVPDARLTAAGDPLPIAPDIAEGDLSPLLGPLPRTPLDEGVRRTLQFYEDALHASHHA